MTARASGSPALSTSGTTAPAAEAKEPEGDGPEAGRCGAEECAAPGASKITCALVPLIPNDDTAERRGRSAEGHSRAEVSSETAPALQSTWEDGASTWRVCGRTPYRIA